MPIINSPIPRGPYSIYHESSAYRPLRDSDATAKTWKKSEQMRNQAMQMQNGLSATNRMVQKIGRRIKGMAPLPVQAIADYHPFKIYKPDFTLLANIGTTFDIGGNPTSIRIDPNTPTNLPTTINPNTDGWRIWAIREGMVSQRGYDFAQTDYQLFVPGLAANINLSDFSTSFEVTGCDSIGIGYQQGLPYDFDPSQSTGNAPVTITPIVLPFFFDSSNLYSIALYAQVIRETLQAQIMGVRYQTLLGPQSAFPTPTDSSYVPIGAISSLGWDFYNTGGNPEALTAFQIQYGNVINRYGIFENANDADQLYYSANTNFRGNWQTDPIQNLVFYPGDLIQYQRELDFTATSTVHAPGTGTVTTTVEITDPDTMETGAMLYVTELYMATVVGFTSDPSFDPNFVKVSGVDFDPNISPTPNT